MSIQYLGKKIKTANLKNLKKSLAVYHIVADSPDGPRGSDVMSSKLTTDINNLMLLCKGCHTRIDSNKAFFPIEKLVEMKKQHEKRIERITGITEDKRTTLTIYSANIGPQRNSVNINNAEIAVLHEKINMVRKLASRNSFKNEYNDIIKEKKYHRLKSIYPLKT